MAQPAGLTPVGFNVGRVLSVSPFAEDHVALESILKGGATPGWDLFWDLCRTSKLSSALAALRREEYPVVVCERDLPLGTWKDLVESARCLKNPPLVIVTSRLADEHLWAEALNFGAYDVLSKPFYPAEVIRGITLACSRWLQEREIARAAKVSAKSPSPTAMTDRWRAVGC